MDPTPDTPIERDEKALHLADKVAEKARVLAAEESESARVLASERVELARVLAVERAALARQIALEFRKFKWETRVLYLIAFVLVVGGTYF